MASPIWVSLQVFTESLPTLPQGREWVAVVVVVAFKADDKTSTRAACKSSALFGGSSQQRKRCSQTLQDAEPPGALLSA